MSSPANKLIYDEVRGVYIPRDFATDGIHEYFRNINPEDINICAEGPDHELYWEAWDNIRANATYTDPDGITWHLYQDGDLWLEPDDCYTDSD